MLTIRDFTTIHENLVNLLSVATYGNHWPLVRAYKSDARKGLFENCTCREDKWATALLLGKGIIICDLFSEDWDGEDELPETAKHRITIADVRNGLKLMRDKYPYHFADLVSENDDLYTGDVWLQLAVFGEVIYG